jgi:hypothetical protein
MSNENLLAWIKHFQQRIILQDEPEYKYTIMLNVLICVYQGISCADDVDGMVDFLNANLPCLDYEVFPTVSDSSLTYQIPISPCEFYDIKVDIFVGGGTTPTGITLLNSPSFFVFENGFYTFKFETFINDFQFAFPNEVFVAVSIKADSTETDFVEVIPKTLVGYVELT